MQGNAAGELLISEERPYTDPTRVNDIAVFELPDGQGGSSPHIFTGKGQLTTEKCYQTGNIPL
jgi:hypothetical protein